MHYEEWAHQTPCADCGQIMSVAEDRGFIYGEGAAVCFHCAVRRGGSYDGDTERWVVAPNVSDLPDERRPHP
jgi:hypothetical protein